MNLNYTPKAISDLENIRDYYISETDEIIADRNIARILQAMEILEKFPLIGRKGRVEDTHEWSVSGLPYIGVYRFASETDISIVSIIHTSLQYPKDDEPNSF